MVSLERNVDATVTTMQNGKRVVVVRFHEPNPWEQRLDRAIKAVRACLAQFGVVVTGLIPGRGYGGPFILPEPPGVPETRKIDLRSLIRRMRRTARYWPRHQSWL